jgi:hypothetical protein
MKEPHILICSSRSISAAQVGCKQIQPDCKPVQLRQLLTNLELQDGSVALLWRHFRRWKGDLIFYSINEIGRQIVLDLAICDAEFGDKFASESYTSSGRVESTNHEQP